MNARDPHHDQPLTATQQLAVDEILERLRDLPGALFPILHAIQDELGYVPPASVADIAKALNRSRAEVHGVISFYHHFRTHPAGRNVVQICRAEACQSMGSTKLEEHAKKSLGVDYHETTADGAVTLEAVYCLGNCSCSPSIRVNDDIVGRVNNDRFDEIIAELREAQ